MALALPAAALPASASDGRDVLDEAPVVRSRADTRPAAPGIRLRFTLGDQEWPLVGVEPGAMTCDVGERVVGVPRCRFGTWRVEKLIRRGDYDWRDWFQSFARGDRKMDPEETGSLTYLDGDGQVLRRVEFYGVVPVRYSGLSVHAEPRSAPATEIIEFDVRRVNFGVAVPGDRLVRDVAPARRDEQDARCERPADRALAVRPLRDVTVAVDLGGDGANVDRDWFRASGGDLVLEWVETDQGREVAGVEYSEIELAGPVAAGGTRGELLAWLNTWSTGEGERQGGRIALEQRDGCPVRTISFFDAFPVAYYLPSVRAGDDSLLEERFVIKAERIEDA